MTVFTFRICLAACFLSAVASPAASRAALAPDLKPVPCVLNTPRQINTQMTKLIKALDKRGDNMPNDVVIASPQITAISSGPGDLQMVGAYEAVIRPKESGSYALPFLPIVSLDLHRDTEAFYLCVHPEAIQIYFLRGYGLDHLSFMEKMSSPFESLKLEVGSFDLRPTGVSEVVDLMNTVLKGIPIVSQIPFISMARSLTNESFSYLQEGLIQGMAEFQGYGGIQRVTLTSDGVELAAGVVLDDPHAAAHIKKISLTK